MIANRKRNVQHGRGIGSILSTIFSKIAPIARTIFNIGKKVVKSTPVKKVFKSAQEEVIKSGIQVADDVLQGKNVQESLKQNASTAANQIAKRAVGEAKKYAGLEPKPKKQKQMKKRRKKDIFSK